MAKGKKKRQKRKPVKQMAKITTGLWEQSFLVANLPQFVDARMSEWDFDSDGLHMRIGEWIGISGDLSQIMGMMTTAQDVETMNSMNSAQISSLVPYIKIEKKPTKAALETIPNLSPDPVEIPFKSFQNAQDILTSRPKYSGLVDIRIMHKSKFGKSANMAGCEVEIKFMFDSMKTFSENQTAGISFMDLIPGLDAMSKSAGSSAELYQLILTIGYANPWGSSDSLFSGPMGREQLDSISRSIRQYNLQSAGEHDIQIGAEGQVELSIKYRPIGYARKTSGLNSELREDILGPSAAPSFKALQEELQELEKELETQSGKAADAHKKINKAKQDLYADKRKKLEEALRADKAEEMKDMSPEEKEALNYQIKLQADSFASSYQPPTDTQDEEESDEQEVLEFDGDELQDIILNKIFDSGSDLKQKMDEFHEKFEQDISAAHGELLKVQSKIKDITQKISDKNKANVSEGILNDRYSNLVRQMVEDGTMRYLDISVTNQKKAVAGSKGKMDAAAKKFREDVLPKLIYEGAKIDYKNVKTVGADGFAAEQVKEISEKSAQEKESGVAYPKTTVNTPSQVRSQPPYIDGALSKNRRLYYFYLGDLLDIVMQNFYNDAKKTSSGAIHVTDRERESLVLGNFYYVIKEGKDPSKFEKATAYHMGDFPISFYAFNDWFVSTFVRRGVNQISLSFFLNSLADEFFNSHPALSQVKQNQVGPFLNSKLPDQPFTMSYIYTESDGQIPRGMDQRQLGGLYDINTEFFRKMLGAQKTDSNEPSKAQKYGYHFFGPSPIDSQVPPVPTYTLHLGSAYGFLKSVKYNKKGGGKAVRTMRIKEGGPGSKLGLPGSYTVQIEMLGAPFAEPFQMFDLNNNVFGIQSDREVLDTTLPRILKIMSVEHKISNGSFTTSLECTPTGMVPRKYVTAAGEVIGDFDRPGVQSKSKKKGKGKKKPPNTSDPATVGMSMAEKEAYYAQKANPVYGPPLPTEDTAATYKALGADPTSAANTGLGEIVGSGE